MNQSIDYSPPPYNGLDILYINEHLTNLEIKTHCPADLE